MIRVLSLGDVLSLFAGNEFIIDTGQLTERDRAILLWGQQRRVVSMRKVGLRRKPLYELLRGINENVSH